MTELLSNAHLQVLGKVFEVITLLVNNSNVSKKDAFTAIGGLVDKMSDIKLKAPAGEALFAISETHGPQFVFIQLHKKAANHKNPKVAPYPVFLAFLKIFLNFLAFISDFQK